MIRAEFLLDFGGRMWSLIHKPTGRELLYRNPNLQLANLALRNAWFAGGVEWNLGTTGHTALTCAPMHAARVTRHDGVDVLRLWEWERLRGLVYQLDIWAPPGSEVLLVQVRIANPQPAATPVYWWSNMAVPETPDTRVVVPATHAWRGHDGRSLQYVPAPSGDPLALDHASDHFFDIPEGQRKWIAALGPDGAGLVQTSTDRLLGRKMFLWGTGPGGRRWQEWLSRPGFRYLEIQAGLAHTQLEHLSLPAGESWSWVEAYGLLDAHGDPAAALEKLIPRTTLDAIGGCLDQVPDELLHAGSGWGAVEHQLRPFDLPGTPFPHSTIGAAEQPWWQLASTGELPSPAAHVAPASYVVGDRWRALLEQATPSWFARLHLGVARYHHGDLRGASSAWEESRTLSDNPWAARNLAVLANLDGDPHAAVQLLQHAYTLVPEQRAIAVELLTLLIAADPDGALAFVDQLSAALRAHGRIRMLECRAAVAAGDLPRAGHLLKSGLVVDDLREGEDSLARLWFSYHRALYPHTNDYSQDRFERENPVPADYDFRMSPGDPVVG